MASHASPPRLAIEQSVGCKLSGGVNCNLLDFFCIIYNFYYLFQYCNITFTDPLGIKWTKRCASPELLPRLVVAKVSDMLLSTTVLVHRCMVHGRDVIQGSCTGAVWETFCRGELSNWEA